MKKYDKRRYTKERHTGTTREVYDSTTNAWIALAIVMSSNEDYSNSSCRESYSGNGGSFGGGGASGNWDSGSSSSDSGGSSGGGD